MKYNKIVVMLFNYQINNNCYMQLNVLTTIHFLLTSYCYRSSELINFSFNKMVDFVLCNMTDGKSDSWILDGQLFQKNFN